MHKQLQAIITVLSLINPMRVGPRSYIVPTGRPLESWGKGVK
jgi:hypothetical protein